MFFKKSLLPLTHPAFWPCIVALTAGLATPSTYAGHGWSRLKCPSAPASSQPHESSVTSEEQGRPVLFREKYGNFKRGIVKNIFSKPEGDIVEIALSGSSICSYAPLSECSFLCEGPTANRGSTVHYMKPTATRCFIVSMCQEATEENWLTAEQDWYNDQSNLSLKYDHYIGKLENVFENEQGGYAEIQIIKRNGGTPGSTFLYCSVKELGRAIEERDTLSVGQIAMARRAHGIFHTVTKYKYNQYFPPKAIIKWAGNILDNSFSTFVGKISGIFSDGWVELEILRINGKPVEGGPVYGYWPADSLAVQAPQKSLKAAEAAEDLKQLKEGSSSRQGEDDCPPPYEAG